MKKRRTSHALTPRARRLNLDHKLAGYLAASASIGALAASEAKAVIVSNNTVQPFGINEDVSIDFNSDGQIDYQIDHDRFNVNGTDLDFLQLDKNDVTSPSHPYGPSGAEIIASFPLNNTQANGDHAYISAGGPGDLGFYPKALIEGTEIGPLVDTWDFQEGDGFGIGRDNEVPPVKGIIHANRLIDEDQTQIDTANPNPPANKVPTLPFGDPGWAGLLNETRYLGVRIDLNDFGKYGLNDDASQSFYGWIGVKITNLADATGEVTGWGYNNEIGQPIKAGELAPVAPGIPGDYNGNGKVDAADYVLWRNGGPLQNDATAGVQAGDYDVWKAQFGKGAGTGSGLSAVPEPSSLLLGLGMGLALLGSMIFRRLRRAG